MIWCTVTSCDLLGATRDVETICEVSNGSILYSGQDRAFAVELMTVSDAAQSMPSCQGLNAWIEKETEKLRKLQQHGQDNMWGQWQQWGSE